MYEIDVLEHRLFFKKNKVGGSPKSGQKQIGIIGQDQSNFIKKLGRNKIFATKGDIITTNGLVAHYAYKRRDKFIEHPRRVSKSKSILEKAYEKGLLKRAGNLEPLSHLAIDNYKYKLVYVGSEPVFANIGRDGTIVSTTDVTGIHKNHSHGWYDDFYLYKSNSSVCKELERIDYGIGYTFKECYNLLTFFEELEFDKKSSIKSQSFEKLLNYIEAIG